MERNNYFTDTSSVYTSINTYKYESFPLHIHKLTLAVGDVADRPASPGQALGHDLGLAGGELLAHGAGERHSGAENSLPAGANRPLARLQHGAVW